MNVSSILDNSTKIDNYIEIKECSYKGEHYSVRDNGAVLRHKRVGKRIRNNDNTWTFGRPNKKTGYMEIGSERVHRIVAFAFLGEPPTPQHVVDHIDTNRRNNRPQNLRWLTRLENVLNNPITRKKIESYCGSIEAFVKDPSIIRKFTDNNQNFEWMRTVTANEAKAAYERLQTWSKRKDHEKSSNGTIGEWIYTPSKRTLRENKELSFDRLGAYKPTATQKLADKTINVDFPVNHLTESLTLNAMQKDWHTPTEFPLCPYKIGDKPLTAYLNNLKIGAVVTSNQYSSHFIDDFVLCKDNRLVIRAHTDNGQKKFSTIFITFENGKYIHESKTYFEERGAQKALTLAQGLEWNGENGIDDYCY